LEAAETFYAERIVHPVRFASAADMSDEHRLVEHTRLPRVRGSQFTDATRILWIEGRDLFDDASVWAPYEMVHTDFTVPFPPGSGNFVASTNGLASGNHPLEAIGHGVCEVIERDAASLFDLQPDALEARRLDLSSVDDLDCLVAIDRFRFAGLAVAAWDLTSEIGIAAFRCEVIERSDGPGLLALPAQGSGCHPDRGVALFRALAEAAQARVTAIAGARDDIYPQMYGRSDDPEILARWRGTIASAAWGCQFAEVPHRSGETLDEDVQYELDRLHGAGFSQAVAVDLSPADDVPISVFRVIVPGLESLRHPMNLPGQRALALARASR
jgi:YcaO-like protein with predicted kinase domain